MKEWAYVFSAALGPFLVVVFAAYLSVAATLPESLERFATSTLSGTEIEQVLILEKKMDRILEQQRITNWYLGKMNGGHD